MKMKKKAAKQTVAKKKPAAKSAPAKKAPAKAPAAAPAAEPRKRTGTYTPTPVQGIGWAPFRYPLQ